MGTHPSVEWSVIAAEVLLGVDYETLPAGERFFEEGIARCERDAIVTAFDNEVDGGEHRPHFGESSTGVAEEVSAGEIGEGGEGAAGEEGGGGHGSCERRS